MFNNPNEITYKKGLTTMKGVFFLLLDLLFTLHVLDFDDRNAFFHLQGGVIFGHDDRFLYCF